MVKNKMIIRILTSRNW